MEQINMFEVLPEEEAIKFRPKESNDWKWTFKDYPKEKNGLKVFSCFACGGVQRWVTNSLVVML